MSIECAHRQFQQHLNRRGQDRDYIYLSKLEDKLPRASSRQRESNFKHVSKTVVCNLRHIWRAGPDLHAEAYRRGIESDLAALRRLVRAWRS